jgi:hypothetical protein
MIPWSSIRTLSIVADNWSRPQTQAAFNLPKSRAEAA